MNLFPGILWLCPGQGQGPGKDGHREVEVEGEPSNGHDEGGVENVSRQTDGRVWISMRCILFVCLPVFTWWRK